MGTYKNVLTAGNLSVDMKLSGRKGSFYRDGNALKLTLERIDEALFWELFLDHYFFRDGKAYGTARKFAARLGFRNKTPLEMTPTNQQFKLKIPCRAKGHSGELSLTYSPAIGHLSAIKL